MNKGTSKLHGRDNGFLYEFNRYPSKEQVQEFQSWLRNRNGVCDCARSLATFYY
jgi:hypothetical protein